MFMYMHIYLYLSIYVYLSIYLSIYTYIYKFKYVYNWRYAPAIPLSSTVIAPSGKRMYEYTCLQIAIRTIRFAVSLHCISR